MAYCLEACSSYTSGGTSIVQAAKPGPIKETLVEANASEQTKVKNMIRNKLPHVNITKIEKVHNNFMEAMYMLKKEEYMARNQYVNEYDLLHVTGADNVNSIIRDNFDWRRTTRGKFGLGVSFSGDAGYANRYANMHIGTRRAFIVTKVLMSNLEMGDYGMEIPTGEMDTTTGNNQKVYVKFYDNEMLPQFVAYYDSSSGIYNPDDYMKKFVASLIEIYDRNRK